MSEKSSRGGVGGPKRRCRYGAECRNKHSCKFYHPSSTEAGNNNDTRKPNPKLPEKKNAAPKRDRSKIQCRYGMECRNTKCPFFHHPAASAAPILSPISPTRTSSPNDAANNLVNGKAPPKSSPISHLTRNGINKQSGTPPVTSEQSLPQAHSTTNRKASNTFTPSRKATTKKKCRWGAGCRNKKCTFVHPGQQFDRDTFQNHRKKDTMVVEEGTHPKSNRTVLPHKAVRSNQGIKEKVVFTTRAIHSILPPSPVTQESLDPNMCYSTSLLFPTPNSHVRAPLQSSSMPINRMQTSEVVSHFNNILASVSNAPPSGFSDDEPGERTPLYNKNAFACLDPHSLENHVRYCQPAKEAAKVNHLSIARPQEQPPDADWLFEVLGLNDIDLNSTRLSKKSHSVIENEMEDPYNTANLGVTTSVSGAKANLDHVPPVYHMLSTPQREVSHDGDNLSKNQVDVRPSKKLIPEEEILLSRRAALELRLESQQSPDNPELLSTLLQTCRSKQEMIQTALECSMDSSETGTHVELNENNIVALLELNELLVGAIGMAESSLCMTKKIGKNIRIVGTKEPAAVKSRSDNSGKGSEKVENDSLMKPTNKHAAPTMAKTKKTKANDNIRNLKKIAIKTLQLPKPVDIFTRKSQEQEKHDVGSPRTDSPDDNCLSKTALNSVDVAQQEREKMARMLEQARKQAIAARERKKNKKSQKFDRWLKQNEEARKNRAKSWSERIAKENDYVDLIQKLYIAEFLRQSKSKAMGLTADRVLLDTDASKVIAKECREAYHTIFGGLKWRVIVAGSENKDMNGRQGTIRYWDRVREKYCVGLDTKKSPDSDIQYLIPETLDLLASSHLPKTDRKSSATSYDIDAPHLISYGGVYLGFKFRLQKSHVVALGSAESTNIGLEAFCKSQDEEERRQKMEEEAEKKREEEDRKRRAVRRARENAAWEQRKEQMRRDKVEYEKMKKEWTNERCGNRGSMFNYDDGDDLEECQCPRCRFGDRFGDRFSSSEGAFFFNIGGIPFRVRFNSYDSDEDSFFDEFDERWEERFAEEKEEQNKKQSDVLGVESDADARTIKLAYRKMALQFHPDKWKSNNEYGMSRKDAENRFKSIQNAYDHLMSNFDD